jgi:hypothetical protein
MVTLGVLGDGVTGMALCVPPGYSTGRVSAGRSPLDKGDRASDRPIRDCDNSMAGLSRPLPKGQLRMTERRVVSAGDYLRLSEVRTENDRYRGRARVWSKGELGLRLSVAEVATIDVFDRARRREHGSAA